MGPAQWTAVAGSTRKATIAVRVARARLNGALGAGVRTAFARRLVVIVVTRGRVIRTVRSVRMHHVASVRRRSVRVTARRVVLGQERRLHVVRVARDVRVHFVPGRKQTGRGGGK